LSTRDPVTIRVQGGTAGILAALASGRLDPLDAYLPEEPDLPPMSGADRRALKRRHRRRAKRIAALTPF